MLVETKVLGQRVELADREISLPVGVGTLRALLAELVRVELEAYDHRRDDQLVLRILTPKDLAEGQATGRFTSGGRDVPKAPDLETATARAIEAFVDGLFLVILDGRQIEEIDAPVEVTPDSRLRLVRLVALAGG